MAAIITQGWRAIYVLLQSLNGNVLTGWVNSLVPSPSKGEGLGEGVEAAYRNITLDQYVFYSFLDV